MTDDNDRLLSDAQFTELMTAEYRAAGQPADELARQRVWQRLARSLGAPVPHRRMWSYAAALLVAALIVPILITSPLQDDVRVKGDSPAAIDVRIAVRRLQGGAFETISTPLSSGDTLVFMSATNQPAFVALALSVNEQPPQIKFQSGDTLLGSQWLVDRGNAYGYRTEPGDRVLRACLVAAATSEALDRRLTALNNEWPLPVSAACTELNVATTN